MNDYCLGLVAYVIHHGPRIPEHGKKNPRPMTDDEAAAWLDANTIGWRMGEPPSAVTIEIEDDSDEEKE